jgi:pimeloyl-ACP methyl ester carboxylesterase
MPCDIVLIDQRGTGDSNASDTASDARNDRTVGCRCRRAALRGHRVAGGDRRRPTLLHDERRADDVEDVRAALGYEAINLMDLNGGTLAQYCLRQHGTACVAVLDGEPPSMYGIRTMAASSQAALDLLVQRCDEDAACEEAFPQFAEELAAVVDRLATPITLIDPESGEEAVIDLTDFADAVHAALLTEATAGQIPLAIHLAHQEKWIEAAQIISGPASAPNC